MSIRPAVNARGAACLTALCLALLLQVAGPLGHEVPVHERLTAKAVEYWVRERPELAACSATELTAALKRGVRDEDNRFDDKPFDSTVSADNIIGRYFFHFSPALGDTVSGAVSGALSYDVTASCDSSQWGFSSVQCDAAVSSSVKRFEQLQKTNIFRYPEVLTLLNAQTGTATKPRGWEGVGHLVHMLEDLTSPPHTNNDAHPHLSNIIANTLLGDPSQFELVNNNTDVLPEPPAGLLRSFDGLSESDIFKELQGFVAANFVSEKNVGRAEGVERGGYLVTIPEHCIVPDGPSCGRSVKIARISRKLLGIPVVLIDKTVAKEQFTRLAQTVVIYAASVLNFIHEKRAPVCEEQL